MHGYCLGLVPSLVIPEADVTWFTVAKARNADYMTLELAKLVQPTPHPAAFHGAKERSRRVQT